MGWHEGIVRPVSVETLGQSYRRYRLADPAAEEAMAGSLRRWGQLAPVVACVRDEQLELLDGFKRQAAARQVTYVPPSSVPFVLALSPWPPCGASSPLAPSRNPCSTNSPICIATRLIRVCVKM